MAAVHALLAFSDCTKEEFRCDMGICMHESDWCNGTRGCPDGSDEPLDCEMCELKV